MRPEVLLRQRGSLRRNLDAIGSTARFSNDWYHDSWVDRLCMVVSAFVLNASLLGARDLKDNTMPLLICQGSCKIKT